MARKLKVFQTSPGFFDLAIAAPSMKAALEAWGADSNLFHQGVAKESEDPKFSEMFLSYILARNARVEEDLVDQLFNSSEKRLARLLLLMANFGKEGRPDPL
jgi:hypothetical protein